MRCRPAGTTQENRGLVEPELVHKIFTDERTSQCRAGLNQQFVNTKLTQRVQQLGDINTVVFPGNPGEADAERSQILGRA